MQNHSMLIMSPACEDTAFTTWLYEGQEGRSDDPDILRQLAQLPGGKNVCVLLPASWFTCQQFTLPHSGFSLTQHAIAWQVEGQSIGNCEMQHWTVIGQHEGVCHVLGINRKRLSALIENCQRAGISLTSVIPDGCYLPVEESTWTALKQEKGWLIRHSEFSWSYVNDALLPSFIHRFAQNVRLICYGTPPEGIVAEENPECSSMALFSRQPDVTFYNVLHGEFRVRPTVSRIPPYWRKGILAFAAATALMWLGAQGAIIWSLHQMQDEQTVALRKQWIRYFPGDRVTGNYRFFFHKKKNITAPDPLLRLSQLETLMATEPSVSLSHFTANQQTGSMNITLSSNDSDAIRRIIEQSRSTLMLQASPPARGSIWALQSGEIQ